jgi:hypothetical protein
LKDYFVVVDCDLLCEYYKKNKSYFKNIEAEDWLKIPYLNDNLKYILDDYIDCDFEKLFSSRKWYNDRGARYLEARYRESIKEENLYNINEINSIPGSLAFYLWKETNLSYKDLLDEMVQIAIKEYKNRSKKLRSFDTNIFEGFNGSKGTKGLKGLKS